MNYDQDCSLSDTCTCSLIYTSSRRLKSAWKSSTDLRTSIRLIITVWDNTVQTWSGVQLVLASKPKTQDVMTNDSCYSTKVQKLLEAEAKAEKKKAAKDNTLHHGLTGQLIPLFMVVACLRRSLDDVGSVECAK